MLRYIDHNQMGHGQHGWLDSYFHFSFAEYFNPRNIRFGALRVVNDDRIQPGEGFDTHPHRDMEILTYVIDGELTHADSMQNKRTLTRGHVQYMSAGTGIQHSEFNRGKDVLRLLQIWILPDKAGHVPGYGDRLFSWEERVGKWMPVATGEGDQSAPIRVHADVNLFAAEIEKGGTLALPVRPGRQAYLILIEGDALVEEISMHARDALEITEQAVTVKAIETAHVLAIEMAKEKAG